MGGLHDAVACYARKRSDVITEVGPLGPPERNPAVDQSDCGVRSRPAPRAGRVPQERPGGAPGGALGDRTVAGGGAAGILVLMTNMRMAKRHLPSSPFKEAAAPPEVFFEVGSRVTHDVYGLGRVTEVEDGIAVVVDFGALLMRITSPYAKLTGL